MTKIAPPHRVSAYMSVHTFTTGLRSVLAPALAYALLVRAGPQATGAVAITLIVISSFFFLSLRREMEATRLAELDRTATGQV